MSDSAFDMRLVIPKKNTHGRKIGACVVGPDYRNDVAATYIRSECLGVLLSFVCEASLFIMNEPTALRSRRGYVRCFLGPLHFGLVSLKRERVGWNVKA